MKKAILSVVTICAVAAFLVGQDSTSAPANESASKSASSKSSASKYAASKATSNPNAKYKIAMKYQPGMKYEIVIKHEQQNTFSMNGQQSQMKMDASFKYYIDAGQPNADGQTPIKMAIRRITMKMQSPNGKDEDFDTDDPDSGKQEVAGKMMAIVSCGYTFYLDKEGNVEKIDGAEEMYDKAMENDPKGTSRRDKDMKEVNSMLTMIFNAPLSCAIGEFSDVGSTWEGVNDKAFAIFDGKDSTSEDMTLKLAEIVDSPNGKIAVIDMESLVDSRGRTVPRTGQIKFNLDKKMIEYIRLESSQEDGQTKNQEKTEIEVKIVKEIPPAKAATSQPASASADSQPAK